MLFVSNIYGYFFLVADSHAALQNGIHQSVFLPALPSSHNKKQLPICWERNIKLLPGISSVRFADVPKWNVKQVAEFIKMIIPSLSKPQVQLFVQQVCHRNDIVYQLLWP